jgi:hypothetical protein
VPRPRETGANHTAACDRTWARREKAPRKWLLARRACLKCQLEARERALQVLERLRHRQGRLDKGPAKGLEVSENAGKYELPT